MSVKGVVRAVGALFAFYLAVLTVAFPLLLVVTLLAGDGTLALGMSFAALTFAALAVYALLLKLGWATEQMFGFPAAGRGNIRLVYRAFLFGAAVGWVMAAAALALAVAGGSASVTLTGESLGSLLVAAGSLALLLLLAALAEELLFRGYPLTRLSAVLGRVGASIVLAVVFALAHLFNPSVSALGLVNIALAALVLSAAFFTPGGLAAAWGLHWGWNAGLGLMADAPVSGLQFDLPALEFSTGEPVWLTGGRFGPEGGLVASLVMIVVMAWLARRNTRTTEDHS